MKRIILFGFLILQLFSTAVTAQVVSYLQQSDGVTFKSHDGTMKIYICQDNIARVTYCADTVLPSKTILTVNKVWSLPSFTVNENDTSIVIATERIRAAISKTSSLLTFYSSGGSLILSDWTGT